MGSKIWKYGFILIIQLYLTGVSYAQIKVEVRVLEKVNTLRDSLNLNPLKLDSVLYNAGKDQAYYMANYNKLGHFQKTFTKETPSERVAYYKGNRTYVGENVATVLSKNARGKFLSSREIADSLFNGWLHSPPHYLNMINPQFTKMGLGYSVSKSSQIFAAQVFSSNEIKVPAAFRASELAWGVRPSEFNCKDDEQQYETMLFANSTIVEDNSVYFYFHDRAFFRNVIRNDNDGLAVDIILREQLPCDKENQFNISQVYDGEMQRPIYKNDIYRFDEANNPGKIKIKLCEVPSYLQDKSWEPNIIVINDNKLCDYSHPSEVPSAIYPLLELQPYYEMGDSVGYRNLGSERTVALKDSIHVELEYLRSNKQYFSIDIFSFEKLLDWSQYIGQIDVACYASVEGATWFNQELLEDRKKAVLELLDDNLFNMNQVDVDTGENWELMDAQINENNIDGLKGKNQTEIKRYLKKNQTGFFDSLLYEQRKTHLYAKIDTNLKIISYSDLLFASNYDSTLTVDFLPWNKILREDYILANQKIEVGLIDSLKDISALRTNLFGASTLHNSIAFMDSLLVQEFIGNVDTSNSKQVFNYASFLTRYWFANYSMSYETKGVAKTISPEVVRSMIAKLDTTEILPSDLISLKVNVLLAGIHYYVAHNSWEHVDGYFQSISNLVKEGTITPAEATELALFCNYFHKFKIAVEILHPFYKEKLLVEDGYFILAKTASLIRHSLQPSDYRAFMETAKYSNQTRYCEWLNRSFQLQRDEYIKEDFCEVCR